MKKLVMVLAGLFVLGMTSVFAIEGKKLDPRDVYKEEKVSWTFNMNNKSGKDVSIFLIKMNGGNEKKEVIEYVIPAKTKDVINFEGTVDTLNGEWWGFGWIDEDGNVGNGGAYYWAQLKEIVIDKDGWLIWVDNGSNKKIAKIKKL